MSRHNSCKKIISSKQKEEVYLELHKMYPTKYGYFISLLKMGDADLDYKLESYTDVYGPFGTLHSARENFKTFIINSNLAEEHNYQIRGPRYENQYGHNTEWYSNREVQ